MGRKVLSDDVIPQVAERFRALSEPARLYLLRVLMHREHTVNELVERTRLGQANVSKHLQVLHAQGFVTRRKRGLFVHYAIADRYVVKLCDLMCQRVDMAAMNRDDAGEQPG
jgi:DNA-binding transcriptional ArsR family regulator